jgi:hypothetical protein
MRLTLRTMLAFLDDLLEPADAQEVGKRIEESEFATSLLHRTRDVTRRLRLGAPKLDGRGMGLDPNTVAEYLDHALPPERVPDFEKVCLESDVHLAEVASAHQILALVLGEPAEVDPQMRRRMYAISAQSDVEAGQESGSPPEISVSTRQAKARQRRSRRRPEVPDYLREQARRRRWKPMVAVALVVVLVAAGLAITFGPTQGWRMLALGSSAGGPESGTPDSAEKQPLAGEAAASASQDLPEKGSAPGPDGAVTAAGEVPNRADSTPAAEITKKGDAKKPLPNLIAPAETATQSAPSPLNEASPAAPVPEPGGTPGPLEGKGPSEIRGASGTPEPGKSPPPSAPMPSAPMPGVPEAGPGDGTRPSLPGDALPPQTAAAPPATETVPAVGVPARPAAEAVGSLATDVEVLLRLDRKAVSKTNPASQAWQRVSSREFLYPGDELLVLPTFRTNVVLSSGGGVKAQILGGAMFSLEPPDDHGVPGIRITEGRLIMMPTGKPGSQVRLLVDQLQGALVFGDADATAAIEVRRSHPDGVDPEKQPAHVTVDLYVPAGVVTWVPTLGAPATGVPAAGAPLAGAIEDTVKAPGRRTLGAAAQQFEPVAATAKDFPEWIAGTGPGAAEKRTADEVEKELAIGKPVHLRLKEIAFRDRRYEYRSLAARCLFQLGDFETFLPLLSDPTQKSYWATQIEAVRTAMARSPETATAVKNTIADQRDVKTAEELYRMLWGYTREDLRKGAAARLVDALDHDDLDIRELSFWNLYHITGFTLSYRPQDVQARRQQQVRAWKQKLESDLIVPK